MSASMRMNGVYRWSVAYHVARSAVVCLWGEFGTLERVDAENLELGPVCFGCLDFWSLRCRASGNLELRVARRLSQVWRVLPQHQARSWQLPSATTTANRTLDGCFVKVPTLDLT